ncbi:MAG TPA: diguanylate cyclase [Pyrinomonadaceae bacterium]|nr:diguanylate cyclase [Pyrinomonadaceae bacterium]
MLGNPTVLVIDDDPDKRQLLVFTFQTAGYHVRAAEDGVMGLAAVAAHHPDLIVTDVMMPNMDGYELARRVRANQNTRFIPIIIQSAARGESQDQLRGAEAGALGYITDPTDLDLLLARARTLIDFKEYLDTCEEAAFTDHLTGLANRRRFERQLEREIMRTLRFERAFCLLLSDIDYFKKVNDTHGHEVGDDTIRHIANMLQSGTRGIDTVARVGGEEFAIILPETDARDALEVAGRLRAAIKKFEVPVAGKVTASFGLAEFPRCAGNGRALFAAADAALYEAKRQGRDRVLVAPSAPGENYETALGVS